MQEQPSLRKGAFLRIVIHPWDVHETSNEGFMKGNIVLVQDFLHAVYCSGCAAKFVVSCPSLLCTNIVHQSFVQCTGAELSCVHSGVQNASLWWHQLLVQVTVHRPYPNLSYALTKMYF